VNKANYQALAILHCGMAIDALPPEERTEALAAARDQIWDGFACGIPLPDLLHKLAKVVRHAQRQAPKTPRPDAVPGA